MAFPDPLALKNAAAAAVSLTRRNPIPNGNLYVDVASTNAVVTDTTIRRILSPKQGNVPASSRNIVTFSRLRYDTDENPIKGSLSVSLVTPSSDIFTSTDINDLFALWAEFLVVSSGDYKSRFIRGEI